jgi:hypothetical protein
VVPTVRPVTVDDMLVKKPVKQDTSVKAPQVPLYTTIFPDGLALENAESAIVCCVLVAVKVYHTSG